MILKIEILSDDKETLEQAEFFVADTIEERTFSTLAIESLIEHATDKIEKINGTYIERDMPECYENKEE